MVAFAPRSSIRARPRTRIEPRPVSYASRIPSVPMMPPVGKSGPLTWVMSSSSDRSGFRISATRPSTISFRLCGAMFVAIPTAIPDAPLTSRFGNDEGSTSGSLVVPS